MRGVSHWARREEGGDRWGAGGAVGSLGGWGDRWRLGRVCVFMFGGDSFVEAGNVRRCGSLAGRGVLWRTAETPESDVKLGSQRGSTTLCEHAAWCCLQPVGSRLRPSRVHARTRSHTLWSHCLCTWTWRPTLFVQCWVEAPANTVTGPVLGRLMPLW